MWKQSFFLQKYSTGDENQTKKKKKKKKKYTQKKILYLPAERFRPSWASFCPFLIFFRISQFQREIKGNQLLLAINENNYLFINLCCFIYVILLKFFLSFYLSLLKSRKVN